MEVLLEWVLVILAILVAFLLAIPMPMPSLHLTRNILTQPACPHTQSFLTVVSKTLDNAC